MKLKPRGWDERDYLLWSQLMQLPSYGLIAGGDRMISRDSVEKLMVVAAERRYDKRPKADAGHREEKGE